MKYKLHVALKCHNASIKSVLMRFLYRWKTAVRHLSYQNNILLATDAAVTAALNIPPPKVVVDPLDRSRYLYYIRKSFAKLLARIYSKSSLWFSETLFSCVVPQLSCNGGVTVAAELFVC